MYIFVYIFIYVCIYIKSVIRSGSATCKTSGLPILFHSDPIINLLSFLCFHFKDWRCNAEITMFTSQRAKP